MWINVSNEGDFNFPHVHGDSLISGAFYVLSTTGSTIRFFNDITNTMPKPKKPNELSFDYSDFECVENRLILFRSDFLHGNARQPAGEKIVVSFNIGMGNS
jgi:hypothetical protein